MRGVLLCCFCVLAGCGARTYLVDPAGGGDFAAIDEALAAAEPGARVRVRPGVYRAPLRLTRPVAIEGEGPAGAVVVEVNDATALVSLVTASVRGVSLRTTGEHAPAAVEVRAGALSLVDCTVQNPALDGVVAQAGAELSVRGCRIDGDRRRGVWLLPESKATLEDCEIIGNGGPGIEVEGGALRVSRCQVHGNGGEGVAVAARGQATIAESTVFGNGRAGVRVADEAHAEVRGCRLFGGRTSGLFWHDGRAARSWTMMSSPTSWPGSRSKAAPR